MPSTTLVSAVMTADVVTLSPDQTVAEAADVLADRGIGAAPVVDSDGRLVGILAADDLIVSEARLHVPTTISVLGATLTLPSAMRHFEEDLRRAVGADVGDLMTKDPVTVGPNDSLETVATVMHDRDVSHVPVVDGGKLVGVVARADLVRFLAATT